MKSLRVELNEGRTTYRPGGELKGRVVWTAAEIPETLQVSLLWFTKGRGTEDAEIVDQVVLHAPGLSGDRAFSFRLPLSPYSFSGRLISLLWVVEAVLREPEEIARQEIILSPSGEEIDLTGMP